MSQRTGTFALEIRLFGGWSASIGGEALPRLRSRTEQRVLAWLALHAGTDVNREMLAGIFWPDSTQERALFYLRRGLSDLRSALGAESRRLESTGNRCVRFDLTGAFLDVQEFDAYIGRGDRESLERALDLYSGSLLPDWMDEWVLAERVPRERAYLDGLERLSALAAERGERQTAIELLQRTIAADPARESAQRALLESLASVGDYAGMARAYRAFRLYLHDELAASTSPETAALYQRLRSEARQTLEKRPSAYLQRLTPRHLRRLPSPVSPLIGRESDLDNVQSCLRSNRLVTLIGAGGVGKTRLAIALADRLEGDFPDGLWFIDLAPLAAESEISDAIAATIGLKEDSNRSTLEHLQDHLRDLVPLLILDNCEHVIGAAARAAETLLARCAHLKVLATSRQPLGVPGEAAWRVPSLGLPYEWEHRFTVAKERAEEILDSASVRLFVDRARRANPAWSPNASNLEFVAQVCRRLDGIPLAIELAASRIKALSVEDIVGRLGDRLTLLTGGSRTLARQQTLRAALDWSWDLLEEAERGLLARLSVFSGRWTLEAAEVICGGEGIERAGVLDLVVSLVDKNLVVNDLEEGPSRYRMMETIRQYADERLEERGEHLDLRQRHLDYFLKLAEEARPKLSSPEQAHWFSMLEEGHDNLRQALRGCLDSQEGREPGLRLGIALQPFWYIRGHLREGREHLTDLLEHAGAEAPAQLHADALNGSGSLAYYQGDYGSAQSLSEESLAIRREAGDRAGIANSLNNLGLVRYSLGDYSAARSLHEESLALRRELGDWSAISSSLNNLGNVHCNLGDFATSRSLHEESLTIRRELGDKHNIAHSLNNLGIAVCEQGDYALARSLHSESLTIRRELEDKHNIAHSLNELGRMHCILGDYSAAQALQEESLALFKEMGDKGGTAWCLNSLGNVACNLGDYDSALSMLEASLAQFNKLADRPGIAHCLCDLGRVYCRLQDCSFARSLIKQSVELFTDLGENLSLAQSLERLAAVSYKDSQFESAARLFAAAGVLREVIGAPIPPNEREDYVMQMEQTRLALGEAEYEAAWLDGRAMTLEEAAEYALCEIERIAAV